LLLTSAKNINNKKMSEYIIFDSSEWDGVDEDLQNGKHYTVQQDPENRRYIVDDAGDVRSLALWEGSILSIGVEFDWQWGAFEDAPKQVGGTHYSKMAIEPIEFIVQNGLGYIEGNVIKYISRYKNKNGLEDLKKARHYIDMLIQQEEGK